MTIANRFARDPSGNVALSFALALAPIVGLAGAALDYSKASATRAQLQVATDAAALRAAQVAVGSDQDRIAAAKAAFPDAAPAADGEVRREVTSVTATVTGQTVTVTTSRRVRTSVLGAVGIEDIPVKVQSTALRMVQGPPVCVLALSRLNPAASGAITVSGNASVTAQNCAMYSNSTAADAILVKGSAAVRAAGYCAVGRVSSSTPLTPAPVNGCDRRSDPFENKFPAPVSVGCDYSGGATGVGSNKSKTYSPGVYCGGIDVKGDATFLPGVYVVKDGALNVNAGGSARGSGVTFFLVGSGAGFEFNGSGVLDLSAPTSGTYSGMLIIQNAASNPGHVNKINGNSDTVVKGAIYAPTQRIEITGNGTFGQQSPFMPLIADQIAYSGSSTTQSDISAMSTPAPLPRFSTAARLLE